VFVQPLDRRPIDLETDYLAFPPGTCLVDERLAADKGSGLELHEPAEAHFEWRIGLRVDQCLLGAVEVDVYEEQPCFDARHVEREHARRPDVEWTPAGDERVPDLDRAIPGNPDLVAEVARVSRAGNVDRHAGNRSAGHPEVFEVPDVGIRNRVQQAAGGGALQGQGGHLL
jgi:hypothetical protein